MPKYSHPNWAKYWGPRTHKAYTFQYSEAHEQTALGS